MTRFRAGCNRECDGPEDLSELAYTALAYLECPGCPHRLEPEGSGAKGSGSKDSGSKDSGAVSFCRWLPVDTPNPFAALAGFREALE